MLSRSTAVGPQEEHMVAGSGLRIGDAEREATAASLREHYAHGRLTIDEFQQRLDAAFAARTDLDLANVTNDLPHVPASTRAWTPPQPLTSARGIPSSGTSRQRTGQGGQRSRSRVRTWATVNLALVMIAIFSIVALFRPFGWLEALIPKPVLILVAILAFLFRGLRRMIRGGRG
jgi:DUF1707 SHOCT-like domain